MVDTRFHQTTAPVALGPLFAAAGHAGLVPDAVTGRVVQGVNELEIAGPEEIALASGPRYATALAVSGAGVVLVTHALADKVPAGALAIACDRPHAVFADLLDQLYPQDTRAIAAAYARSGGREPMVEPDVVLGVNAVLGPGVEIGRGTVIGPNAVIGAGVAIGRDCIIGANATIECAYLGDGVVVHPGARIGTEGFGWLDLGLSNRKIPQLGRVIVQDRVEIGANSTIDRGALGDTVIGDGTKIDNLVQIGHNCRIGRHCLIAAMTGLAGSTVIGDGVLMGGGSGTAGHLEIGANSVVHGRAAVTKDWPAGSKLAGAPAQDIRDFWREIAVLRRMSRGGER